MLCNNRIVVTLPIQFNNKDGAPAAKNSYKYNSNIIVKFVTIYHSMNDVSMQMNMNISLCDPGDLIVSIILQKLMK